MPFFPTGKAIQLAFRFERLLASATELAEHGRKLRALFMAKSLTRNLHIDISRRVAVAVGRDLRFNYWALKSLQCG